MGQGGVIIAKQVIQDDLGWTFHHRPAKVWPRTHGLLFGDPLQVIELFSDTREFFLLNGSRMSPPFRHHLPPPAPIQNSFSSAGRHRGFGTKTQAVADEVLQVLTKIKATSHG